MTQNDMILSYIREFGAITPIEALRDCGCFRLGARVHELKKEGYLIKSEMIEVDNRFGGKTRVAQYTLEV